MSRIAWGILIGIILLVLLALGAGVFLPFWARGLGFGLRPGMMIGFGFPFLLARALGSLLFWLLLILGGVLLFRALARNTGTSTLPVVANESPLEILRRRYANGEISKEQFEEMRQTLDV